MSEASEQRRPEVIPVDLPAHHAVNRYFREQDAHMGTLVEQTSGDNLDRWAERYRRGRLSSPDLHDMASDFHEALIVSGTFGISRSQTLGTRNFPHREHHSLAANFMDPISLGQGGVEPGRSPYLEQALYLRIIRADFRMKKATIGIGASGLVLTRHLLSRIYERTEVDHSRFASLVHDHIDELLANLALAEAAGLWILNGGSRITAVPFAHGLLMVNTRLLLGSLGEGDLGFHAELPSGRMQEPYINSNFLVDEASLEAKLHFTPTVALCGTTYLNQTTLSDAQQDYFYAFEALKIEAGAEATRALAHLYFCPNLAHEKWGAFCLKNHLQPRSERALKLLEAGWLKSDGEFPLACILPFDAKIPKSLA